MTKGTYQQAKDGQVIDYEFINLETVVFYVQDENDQITKEYFSFDEGVETDKSPMDFVKVN